MIASVVEHIVSHQLFGVEWLQILFGKLSDAYIPQRDRRRQYLSFGQSGFQLFNEPGEYVVIFYLFRILVIERYPVKSAFGD